MKARTCTYIYKHTHHSNLENVDCKRLFNDDEYSSTGARGGGKENFVTGVVKKERVSDFINNLVEDIMKLCQ
jgi:hypothetical protein